MKFTSLLLIPILVVCICCLPASKVAGQAVDGGSTLSIYQIPLLDVSGQAVTLGAYEGVHLVLVFLGTDCPISQKYTATINQIAANYGPKQVAIVGIFPQPGTTKANIASFVEHYQLNIPGYIDHKQQLTASVQATVTPEVVIVNPQGQVAYQGAIDNWYYALGKYRRQATEHYLLDALHAIQAGQQVATPHTEAIGCFINTLAGQQHDAIGHKHHK